MKNIFLGMIGLFITIYLLCAGLNIYLIQTKRNELEAEVSRAVEHVLEEDFLGGDEEKVRLKLAQEISATELRVEQIDLEKGLIQVLARENISLVTGEVKEVVVERTAILDRIDRTSQKVSVRFLVDGEIYKEYQLTKGEVCPMPKVPGEMFAGWIEYGMESMQPVESIGEVWEDKVYLAVTE